MLLLGCAIGMHWRHSRAGAVCVSTVCAVLIVAHEIIDGLIWSTAGLVDREVPKPERTLNRMEVKTKVRRQRLRDCTLSLSRGIASTTR